MSHGCVRCEACCVTRCALLTGLQKVGAVTDTVIEFAGFLPPESAVGDYAAVAYFRVGGERLLVTVSVTLAAIVETRAGHLLTGWIIPHLPPSVTSARNNSSLRVSPPPNCP